MGTSAGAVVDVDSQVVAEDKRAVAAAADTSADGDIRVAAEDSPGVAGVDSQVVVVAGDSLGLAGCRWEEGAVGIGLRLISWQRQARFNS